MVTTILARRRSKRALVHAGRRPPAPLARRRTPIAFGNWRRGDRLRCLQLEHRRSACCIRSVQGYQRGCRCLAPTRRPSASGGSLRRRPRVADGGSALLPRHVADDAASTPIGAALPPACARCRRRATAARRLARRRAGAVAICPRATHRARGAAGWRSSVEGVHLATIVPARQRDCADRSSSPTAPMRAAMRRRPHRITGANRAPSRPPGCRSDLRLPAEPRASASRRSARRRPRSRISSLRRPRRRRRRDRPPSASRGAKRRGAAGGAAGARGGKEGRPAVRTPVLGRDDSAARRG